MNESLELASFVSKLKYDNLPQDVIAKAKDLVLDQVGAMMACSTLPWSKVIYQYVHDWGDGKQESTIVHYGDKTKVENAVFANSSFGHGFEIDDMYLPGSSHPGCIVIPSALAMGEKERITGKELILAVVAGYEVMGRINESIGPSAMLRGFHAPTSVSGPFGAAVATGKILGFDSELMVNALAIAGSHASGIIEYDQSGGSVKRMHAGMAAHGGMKSALLAQRGLTGPVTVLEGKHGFCQAFADEYNLQKLTDKLGEDFRVVRGTACKAYCCAGGMHSAIDALRKLIAEHDIKAEAVEEVVMGTNRRLITHVNAKPSDITSAQFSSAFGLALTLIKGSNGFKDYTEENLRDPKILNLAGRVRLEVDPEVDSNTLAKFGSRITVRMEKGDTYQEKVDYCKGNPQNPMTEVEFVDKFRGLASVVADKDRTEEIAKVVHELEKQNDISSLVSLLSH